jgi:hypothetical protein
MGSQRDLDTRQPVGALPGQRANSCSPSPGPKLKLPPEDAVEPHALVGLEYREAVAGVVRGQ